MNTDAIIQAVDPILDRVEEVGFASLNHHGVVNRESPIYDALGLARAIASLIDFGGGVLRLADGSRWRIDRPCVACEVASRMFTRAGLESQFCVRCANALAESEGKRSNPLV